MLHDLLAIQSKMPRQPKGYKAKKKRFSQVKRRGEYKLKTKQETKKDGSKSLPKEQDIKDDNTNKSFTSSHQCSTNSSEDTVVSDQKSLSLCLYQESDTDANRDCSPAKISEACQPPAMEVEECYPGILPGECNQMNVFFFTMDDEDDQISDQERTLDESLHPILKSPSSEDKSPLLVHSSEKHPATSVFPPAAQPDSNATAIPIMHKQELRERSLADSLGVYVKELDSVPANTGDNSDGFLNSEDVTEDSSKDNEAESSSNESSNSDNDYPQEDADDGLLEDNVIAEEAPVLDEIVGGGVPEALGSPIVPVLTAETLQLLERVKAHLLLLLPKSKFQNWNAVVNFDHGILVGLVAPSSFYIVQRSINVAPDGKVTISVHGKHLTRSQRIWTEIQDCVPLEEDAVHQFSENIVKIVASLRLFEICIGVDSCKDYWKLGKGIIDNDRYRERRYKETFRPDSCLMLVKGLREKRCEKCIKVYNAFSKRQKTKTKKGEGPPMTPRSTKPHSSMSSGELKKRIDRDRKEKRNLKRRIKRLQEKVQRLKKTDGELLGESMSDDLLSVLKNANLNNMNDLEKIFLAEQIKAASRKDPRRNTWHPAVIRVALAIRMASPAAYEHLKSVLKLPSEQTLFNYSHVIRPSGTLEHDYSKNMSASRVLTYPKQLDSQENLRFLDKYL